MPVMYPNACAMTVIMVMPPIACDVSQDLIAVMVTSMHALSLPPPPQGQSIPLNVSATAGITVWKTLPALPVRKGHGAGPVSGTIAPHTCGLL